MSVCILNIFAEMPLNNLRHFLICTISVFGPTPFGWPRTMRLHTHCTLHQSFVYCRPHCLFVFIYLFNFVLPTKTMMTCSEETDMMDNCNHNPNVGIMYDL